MSNDEREADKQAWETLLAEVNSRIQILSEKRLELLMRLDFINATTSIYHVYGKKALWEIGYGERPDDLLAKASRIAEEIHRWSRAKTLIEAQLKLKPVAETRVVEVAPTGSWKERPTIHEEKPRGREFL